MNMQEEEGKEKIYDKDIDSVVDYIMNADSKPYKVNKS